MLISSGSDENKLYFKNDKLYRYVPIKPKNRRWDGLYKFMLSDVFTEMQHNRLIPKHNLVDIQNENLIYEVEIVKYISRPWEHTTCQNIELLKTTCDINHILRESEFSFTDCGIHQFAFDGTVPLLLDIGSIDKFPEQLIWSIEVFVRNCEKYCRYNLYEIITAARKLDWIECKKLLIECYETETYSIEKDYWADYPKPLDHEINALKAELSKYQFDSVVDLGGHCGYIAMNLFRNKKCVVIDMSEFALTTGYNNTKIVGLKHNFVRLDLSNPFNQMSIPQEHNLHRSHIHANWLSRFNSDAVFASSILHHLLKNGMTLSEIMSIIRSISNRYIFLEFIAHTDPHMIGSYGPEISIQSIIDLLPGWKLINKFNNESEHRFWLIIENQST